MGGLHCKWRFPNTRFNRHFCRLPSSPSFPPFSSITSLPFSPLSQTKVRCVEFTTPNTRSRALIRRPLFCLSQNQQTQQVQEDNDRNNDDDEEEGEDDDSMSQGRGNGNWTIVLSSSLVGLLTGLGVVLFNYSVHEIRAVFWDGIPQRGASWLREEPITDMWQRVVFVPASGGSIVAILNVLRGALEDEQEEEEEKEENVLVKMGMPVSVFDSLKAASRPFLKAVAACVTPGTGNSLGPEGPSVEIGTSIAKGVGAVFDKSSQRKLSLVAAGSAAGIASGFNAAVSGCFFAVESVLWPSPADSSSSSVSLTNTTSMVILSAVIASVVTQVGLGSEPAFKVPGYDFRSPTELPLYLLLGVLCGLVSLTFSKCTSYMLLVIDNLQKATSLPRSLFPLLGGLSVGLIALAYPEILYWGFENVDILLESRPFVKGLSADLLVQLVVVKIGATSLCRASGLVGGYYAPSLFIGAATGMAYGKFIGSAVAQSNPILHLSYLEVASPQAYGLVGIFMGYIWADKKKRCLKDSLCIDYVDIDTAKLEKKLLVSEAMRTRYVTVWMNTSLTEAVALMLAEKQPCAMVVDSDQVLIGILTLEDIQKFSNKYAKSRRKQPKELIVYEMCSSDGEVCNVPGTATPSMDLFSAQNIMNRYEMNEIPVVTEHPQDQRGHLVGLLDRDCISLTFRALATRESLRRS
ncbi:hypothetical protein ACLB2K_013657 [Fragaria x ananassa]